MLETATLNAILARHDRDPANIIAILQDIQAEVNWLPEDNLRYVCAELDIPKSKMMALATFYKAFSLLPRGRHMIHVCLGTACHVRGGANLLESFERELGIRAGGTTYDDRFSLESVRCVGCCGLAPVFIVDGKFYGKMTQDKVPAVLGEYE